MAKEFSPWVEDVAQGFPPRLGPHGLAVADEVRQTKPPSPTGQKADRRRREEAIGEGGLLLVALLSGRKSVHAALHAA